MVVTERPATQEDQDIFESFFFPRKKGTAVSAKSHNCAPPPHPVSMAEILFHRRPKSVDPVRPHAPLATRASMLQRPEPQGMTKLSPILASTPVQPVFSLTQRRLSSGSRACQLSQEALGLDRPPALTSTARNDQAGSAVGPTNSWSAC